MGKKIVILNGSPRKTGNTSELVKAFTEGAESVGNEVIAFHVGGMDIHGCRGCFGGDNSKECPCVQKDDMAEIYPRSKGCRCGRACFSAVLLEHERTAQNGYRQTVRT